MDKATIIEIVLFKTNDGVNFEEFKLEMAKYNDFLSTQAGFISREIAVSEDGQFLDVTHWADKQSYEMASENLEKNPEMEAFFNNTMTKIDTNTLISQFFDIFSTTKI